MTVYRLFRDLPFEPEHLSIMSAAFEDVSRHYGLAQRDDAIRDIVARAVIECAQRGIRDPAIMRQCARKEIDGK
jgi:hypothetical protein